MDSANTLAKSEQKVGIDMFLGCSEMASSIDMVILAMSSPWGGYSQRNLLIQGDKLIEKLTQLTMEFHFLSQGMLRMT